MNAVMRATARRKFAPLFIEKKLRLNYQETTLRALTDEKWLAFVLEQVLSQRGQVHPPGQHDPLVPMKLPMTVIVEDTGIGIAPEDLPRVFDQRLHRPSTAERTSAPPGLGLYLCQADPGSARSTPFRIASEPGRAARG